MCELGCLVMGLSLPGFIREDKFQEGRHFNLNILVLATKSFYHICFICLFVRINDEGVVAMCAVVVALIAECLRANSCVGLYSLLL